MAEKSFFKIIKPAKQLIGEVVLPGDKSISHRTAILGSLASGSSKISNFSSGKDCQSTLNCMRALGINVSRQTGESLIVHIRGAGYMGLKEAKNILSAGNSATTMRLLGSVLAAQPFLSIISGDISLRSRPMKRLIEPLRLMGAEIYGRDNGSLAPLVIKGTKLHGITYKLQIPSAQVKSAVLLAGLFATGKTTIEQNQLSRDHTERMLKEMGVDIEADDRHITITPLSKQLPSLDLQVPGDISSAAYWLVAGAIHPSARIKILRCGVNPTRTGIIDVLLNMGAKISIENKGVECNEPVADLCVESSQLKATEIKGELIPRLIDEIPILAVAACYAKGTTVIRDAAELRVKESDRIATTVHELSRFGAKIEALSDGMVINGGNVLSGANVNTYSDHRLAMSFAIASLVAKGDSVIEKPRAAEISYPGFWDTLEKLARS
ncbi:3-phosphoshikimate 1-carboxyvinyltransferase [Chloroflexota bacterium]